MALDELFFATELASASFVSLRDQRRVVREIHEALEIFEACGWLDEPPRYHETPPPLEDVRGTEEGVSVGTYQHLRFASGYAPHPGEPGSERWRGYRANETAHAGLLELRGSARPWLICVPGYRMGHPAVDFTGFRAFWLHRRLGLNVAIPVLPLHGPRRVGSRGGDGFFAGDFLDTIHAQTQGVWDVRRLIHWLRGQGTGAVGLYGVSLGAHTTALLASLEPEVDCVIAGIPAADFVRLMRAHMPGFLLRLAEGMGFDFDAIAHLLRVISPLAMPPGVPAHRCHLYAGVADRLARPDHALDLWHHWGKPELTWYEGSHVSFLFEPRARRLIRSALEPAGFIGPSTGPLG